MNEAGMIYKNEKESREVRVMRGEDGGEKREGGGGGETGTDRRNTSEKVTEVGGG